jgi:hypothetical protein
LKTEALIEFLVSEDWYIDFEMGSDQEFCCYIKDGYWEECISRSYYGEGVTLRESLLDAYKKLFRDVKKS